MKKARQWQRTRLWVEELETRVVMSATKAPIAVESTNWSGYAAQTNLNSPANNAVSAVYGTWTVPTVTGTSAAYTSVWVGIDGYSSSTVEQIGTDSDIQIVNGVPTATYYAWYETYPNPSVNIQSYSTKTRTGITVNAGDVITASVVFANGKFNLTLTDTTDHESYSPAAQTVKNAARSSAEWIVEAPSSNSGILPLSNFNTTTFTNASATINGVQSSIDGYNAVNRSSPLWQYTPINMITSRGVVQASTGALTDNIIGSPANSGFTVTYVAPAAPAPAPRPTPPPPPPSWWWWWFSTNEISRIDPMAMTGNSNNSNAALTELTPTAAGPQTQASVSAAPPVIIPMAPSAAPWLSLVGPAQNVGDDDRGPDMPFVPDNLIASGRDLFHPSAVALASVSGVPIETGPSQIAGDANRGTNAVLIAESPAVANAPPASQPEPRGNFVIKSMSKAFWLVAGLAFVSHRSFARGKRRTELYPNENNRPV